MGPPVGGKMWFLALVAAGLVAYLLVAPQAPRGQTVHFILGDAAPRVDELRVRYAADVKRDEMDEDWTREVAFRFADGGAPRIVTHEPRLADGDYVVEIEILTRSQGHATARGRTSLGDGRPAQIDVSQAVPK